MEQRQQMPHNQDNLEALDAELLKIFRACRLQESIGKDSRKDTALSNALEKIHEYRMQNPESTESLQDHFSRIRAKAPPEEQEFCRQMLIEMQNMYAPESAPFQEYVIAQSQKNLPILDLHHLMIIAPYVNAHGSPEMQFVYSIALKKAFKQEIFKPKERSSHLQSYTGSSFLSDLVDPNDFQAQWDEFIAGQLKNSKTLEREAFSVIGLDNFSVFLRHMENGSIPSSRRDGAIFEHAWPDSLKDEAKKLQQLIKHSAIAVSETETALSNTQALWNMTTREVIQNAERIYQRMWASIMDPHGQYIPASPVVGIARSISHDESQAARTALAAAAYDYAKTRFVISSEQSYGYSPFLEQNVEMEQLQTNVNAEALETMYPYLSPEKQEEESIPFMVVNLRASFPSDFTGQLTQAIQQSLTTFSAIDFEELSLDEQMHVLHETQANIDILEALIKQEESHQALKTPVREKGDGIKKLSRSALVLYKAQIKVYNDILLKDIQASLQEFIALTVVLRDNTDSSHLKSALLKPLAKARKALELSKKLSDSVQPLGSTQDPQNSTQIEFFQIFADLRHDISLYTGVEQFKEMRDKKEKSTKQKLYTEYCDLMHNMRENQRNNPQELQRAIEAYIQAVEDLSWTIGLDSPHNARNFDREMQKPLLCLQAAAEDCGLAIKNLGVGFSRSFTYNMDYDVPEYSSIPPLQRFWETFRSYVIYLSKVLESMQLNRELGSNLANFPLDKMEKEFAESQKSLNFSKVKTVIDPTGRLAENHAQRSRSHRPGSGHNGNDETYYF